MTRTFIWLVGIALAGMPAASRAQTVQNALPNHCANLNQLPATSCEYDGDCGGGITAGCFYGYCYPRCTLDSQCAAGDHCVSEQVTNAQRARSRDAGQSGRIGSSVLWLYGDTFYGSDVRSITGAWGHRSDPRVINEEVVDSTLPNQFVPFTPDEQAYNDTHAPGRVALWPAGRPIDLGHRDGLFYYVKLVLPDTHGQSVGIARVKEGDSVATRDPGVVFTQPNLYGNPLLVNEPDQARIYVYSEAARFTCSGFCQCTGDPFKSDYKVARVPWHLAGTASEYEYWNGTTNAWVKNDPSAATTTVAPWGMEAPQWNDYLGAYVAVGTPTFCNSAQLPVVSAPSPVGPFTTVGTVNLSSVSGAGLRYAMLTHAEFGNGRDLLLSAYEALGSLAGRTRLYQLTLP